MDASKFRVAIGQLCQKSIQTMFDGQGSLTMRTLSLSPRYAQNRSSYFNIVKHTTDAFPREPIKLRMMTTNPVKLNLSSNPQGARAAIILVPQLTKKNQMPQELRTTQDPSQKSKNLAQECPACLHRTTIQ